MAEAKLKITDELLVAYVDGELDEAQRAMVNVALDADVALSRRADEMRLARDLLCEAFLLQSEATLPARIDAAMKRLAAACARHALRQRTVLRFRYWPSRAIAAGLVLCTVVTASYVALRDATKPTGNRVATLTQISPDNPLHRVLESTPSAELIKVDGDAAAVQPILTFRAKDGRFCREFEVFSDSQSSSGIACREHGHWSTQVLLSVEALPPDSNFYTPAGGVDEPAIAELVEHLIEGEPLSVQQEARLLASSWRPAALEDP